MNHAGRRWAIVALAVDVALAVALGWAAWRHPATVTVGGRQDAPYTVWAFAWVARALAHGQSPWFSTHLSSPGGVNLLTNATATGLGLVLAPVTRAFGPLVSFNVAATAALAGTAWSTQVVLVRARLAAWPAALVGGLVAGFGPTSLAQTGGGHLHVTAAFLVPPLALGVGRLASGTARNPVRWGVAIGAMTVAQLLIGEEILAISAIAIAIGLVAGMRRLQWRCLLEGGLAAVVVFDAVAAYPLWAQFGGPAHIHGPIQIGDHYRNDLTAFVVPIRQVWLGSTRAASLTRRFSSEGGAYLGAPLVAVAALTAWRGRPLVRLLAVAGAGVAVLSLGSSLLVAGHPIGVPLPWALVAHRPVIESLVPVRFGIVLDLIAGTLLAVALDAVARPPRRVRASRLGIVAAVALAAVCVAPLAPQLPFRTTRWAIPAYFGRGPASVRDNAAIVVSPYPAESDPSVEVWLAEAGARWRSAGGTYFVPDPTGKITIGGPVPMADAVDVRIEQGAAADALAALRSGVLADLAGRHVEAVIAGPGPNSDEVVRWWTSLLGPPRQTGGVDLWLSS